MSTEKAQSFVYLLRPVRSGFMEVMTPREALGPQPQLLAEDVVAARPLEEPTAGRGVESDFDSP